MLDIASMKSLVKAPLNIPAVASKYHFAILFAHSRSPSMPMAVAAARNAKFFREFEQDGHKYYLACFDRTANQMKVFNILLKLTYSRKSTQVFFGGDLEEKPAQVFEISSCFVKSLRSRSAKRYCGFLADDPDAPPDYTTALTINFTGFGSRFNGPAPANIKKYGAPKRRKKKTKYLLPCKYAASGMDLKPGTIEEMKDQLHDRAIENRCVICPNYKLENLAKVRAY